MFLCPGEGVQSHFPPHQAARPSCGSTVGRSWTAGVPPTKAVQQYRAEDQLGLGLIGLTVEKSALAVSKALRPHF